MKKLIEGFSLLFLICFSFFYTDKVINIINKKDPLMVEIVNIKSDYDVLPVNATVSDDTIIPGIKGQEINVNESYENMKLGGIFREEVLVFKSLYPSSSLKDNNDKYIIKGNGTKKQVSIILIFNNNYIDEINGINNLTIFMNHKDLTISNINLLKDRELYTYGNNGVYNKDILTNDNTLINRLSNNKSSYCLTKNKNDELLNVCSDKGMFTVIPNIVGGYYDVKSNLSNGSIILLNSLNDVDIIIKYIKSKGYDIVGLSELLNE